tara:strand:- start:14 stop:799 length:786 start_codon:yes stop_codon:yes gene_type:complete
MIKLKDILTEAEVSKELWYHIENDISLEECVFRYGSKKYFLLMNEAKSLMNEGTNFDSKTKALLETDLGEFGMYEDKEVPLDFPMINEEREDYVVVDKRNLRPLMMNYGGGQFYEKWSTEEKAQADADELNRAYQKTYGAVEGPHVVMYKSDYYSEKRKQGKIDEADKKKKDPPIGKPKRGGPKAYYVYVRDPKTKRIKKVTFGSGGLRAKINNPKARRAFAARHRCAQAKDRTTARYWSCRLPRYAKQLGLSVKNPGGFW